LRLLRELDVDIISTQDQYTNLYGTLAHYFTNIPVVMTRHIMDEPTYSRKKRILARLTRWANRRGADRIIAVSEAVRQNLARHSNIPLSRIETIYNGIEVERFETQQQRAAKRDEMGWPESQPTVVMVAVLRHGKGHEVLFEAIPQVQARIPGVRIKLVGSGKLESEIRQQAAPLGEVVEFLGQRTDVPELLGASDVLVLPSWSEALPTVLIEAGAASLPVVATDVGGAAEIVADGETGYLVPAGDSAQLADRLIQVLADPVQAHRMGAKAKLRVDEMFSLQRQAQQTIALYKRTIAGK
jgi:glycosyltransferase involved in cell wall biosynthesis